MNAGNLFRTRTTVAIPELALIAATRGMLGAGIGLLVADRIRRERRRAIGWTLCSSWARCRRFLSPAWCSRVRAGSGRRTGALDST